MLLTGSVGICAVTVVIVDYATKSMINIYAVSVVWLPQIGDLCGNCISNIILDHRL